MVQLTKKILKQTARHIVADPLLSSPLEDACRTLRRGMTPSCGMRGTALKTRVLESTTGTEFARVKFPAHTFWKGQK